MTITITKFPTYEEASGCLSDRRAEDLNATRDLIFNLFGAAGIAEVKVQFDGSGDEGQIGDIDVTGATDMLPAENIEKAHTTIEFEYDDGTTRRAVSSYNVTTIAQPETSRALLERLCYDLLEVKHSYWGDGEGAYGAITFDTCSRTITVDFNERFIDSTNHNYEI